ncbi:MAG: hypothetical protein EXR01_03475 [Acetobacteraceae bacterium]|nr:hypothetical protein [Acetobacteraceae bacterium]
MAQIPGITVETPETNLAFFDTSGMGMTMPELAWKLCAKDVMVSVSETYRDRASLNLDVTAAMVDEVLSVMR